ncbi:MAG TPA: hypothetical protein VL326_00620, partial [Kofleriaceae bacterium]|nr:hypothetical protein [Kofleriaceae bacterium]
FWLQRGAVARRLRSLVLRPRIAIVIGCVALATLWCCAWAACDRVVWYDTGLYHLGVMKWNATYPATPGLANLHGRFGYDNSVHVYAAYVDAYWEGVAVHAMNGFFIALVLVQWFVEMFSARTPRGRLRQIYCLLTIPFILGKLWTVEVASLSSDLPLALMSLVLVLDLLSLPRARSVLPIVYVLALATATTTTKFGGLGLAVPTLVLAIIAVRRSSWRVRWVVFGLPLVLTIAWLVRNVIVSGWLVFPVFGHMPVPWAVPKPVGEDHLRWIESWARIPGKTPAEVLDHGFRHWFVTWFEQFRRLPELVLFFVSLTLLVWRIVSGPSRSAATRAAEWTAIAAGALGILQWFVGAPDVRFGGFLFWLLPAALVAPMLAGAMSDRVLRAPTRTFALLVSLMLTAWTGGLTPRLGTPPRWFGRPPDPRLGDNSIAHTANGMDFPVPVKGDQCWDSPLLCTPYAGAQTLRDRADPGAGFNP